tara:strand:+ start:200 stop:973 length:774 start_codon:yes stop_codon:yes gene_type:complete
MGKYFAVTVKPTIDIAALKVAFADTEILFDWMAFDKPKGASKLIGITALYTGKNGVDYTSGDFELFFAKTVNNVAPGTLGDDGAAVDTFGWFPNLIGKTYMDSASGANDGDLIMGNVWAAVSPGAGALADANPNNKVSANGVVLQGEPDSGTNVGFDKLYVAAIAKGAHQWGNSTMQVSTETATSTPTLIVKTLDALLSGIGPGDVLRDEDNQLLGTIKSVDSATQITLEDNCASVSAVNKDVYNTSPITLILSFEK